MKPSVSKQHISVAKEAASGKTLNRQARKGRGECMEELVMKFGEKKKEKCQTTPQKQGGKHKRKFDWLSEEEKINFQQWKDWKNRKKIEEQTDAFIPPCKKRAQSTTPERRLKSRTSLMGTVFGAAQNGRITCPLLTEQKLNSGGHAHGPPNSHSFKTNRKGGTNKEWMHLKRWHSNFLRQLLLADENGEVEKFVQKEKCKAITQLETQPTILASFTKHSAPRKFLSWSNQALEVIFHGHSFASLDSEFHQEAFLVFGDAGIALTSYVMKAYVLPVMLELVEEKLKEIVCAQDSLAITFDGWTDVGLKNYLGVTGHYINNDWELQDCVLDLVFMPEGHDAKNLKTRVWEVLDKYTDNTVYLSGVVADGEKAGQNCAKEIVTSENSFWCFAHRLQLCVMDAFSAHATAITEVRDFISTVKGSKSLRHALHKAQKKLRPNEKPKHLILDCKTRWSSLYDMLARFLELYPVFSVASVDIDLDFNISLPMEGYRIATIACAALRFMRTLTQRAQRTKFANISLILVWVDELIERLTKVQELANFQIDDSLSKFVDVLLKSVRRRFVDIWEPSSPAMRAAAFNVKINLGQFVEKNVVDAVWENLLEEAKIMYQDELNTVVNDTHGLNLDDNDTG